jgi:hypothetical protein
MFGLALVALSTVVCGGAPPAVSGTAPEVAVPSATPAPALPISNEVSCWTVVTVVEPGPPPELGGTTVQVQFTNYSYDGIVAGGGFVKPARGSLDEVSIGGKKVTLSSHDFGNGSVATQEFGNLDVLFTSNTGTDCAYLIATPDQLVKIAEWIQ